jgi:hypothetical protein
VFVEALESTQVVGEFKCCLDERTSRGVLYVTNDGLYFFSKMLGEKKVMLPLSVACRRVTHDRLTGGAPFLYHQLSYAREPKY